MGTFGKHILDEIHRKFANPILRVLYPDVCCSSNVDGGSLPGVDFRFGFAIGYAAKGDVRLKLEDRNISRTGLDYHTDDSEVSLTVRLGREYEGGEVRVFVIFC